MDNGKKVEEDGLRFAQKVYLENRDGSYKVRMTAFPGTVIEDVKKSLLEYKYRENEYLLATYCKCGTHLGWEIMQMLINGSADYIEDYKLNTMLDCKTMEQIDELFPTSRVLNTHYRLDVIGEDFRKLKTVCILRNPKDAVVSFHRMTQDMGVRAFGAKEKTLEEFITERFVEMDENTEHGSYFDYTEYMWNAAKNNPNMLVLFFEDIKKDPVGSVEKINQFMGTNRDQSLVQEIADATDFAKMKIGKKESEIKMMKELISLKAKSGQPGSLPGAKPGAPPGTKPGAPPGTKPGSPPGTQPGAQPNPSSMNPDKFPSIYRKGIIGDWKNHFTVAMNERFDELLKNWKVGSEIPFTYE